MNKTTLVSLVAMMVGAVAYPPNVARASAPTPAAAAADGDIELAGEWSLAERSTWKQIYADRMQYLNLMNSTCGTSIKLSFDHEAFRDRLPSVDANRSEDWNASALITAIRNVCLEGEAEKAAVAAKIRSIKFVRGTGDKHKLARTRLRVGLDLEANPREYVNDFSAWLRSSL